MRKSAIIFIMGLILFTSSGAAAAQQDEMLDLAAAVTGQSLPVASWQVTIKEDMSRNKARRLLTTLQAKHGYKVTGTEKEKAVNYDIESGQEKQVTERFHITIPKNARHQAAFSAILQGESWNKEVMEAYRERKDSVRSAYFTDRSTTFACLTADIDDKIKEVYIIRNMKKSLQLENVEVQHDNVENASLKTIVYGYTPQWKQVMTMDQPTNFQMAIHESTSGGKRLTIGTPILINEY
ncbi:hypothetical protein GCM10028778_22960 [Barrientosiimonas marina]|uniref:YwmB family TATA-box binding protein n=1 Tax=Lentibacillus kimchii TaxID=1542911 RepID=A0ABW2UX25_9BACI